MNTFFFVIYDISLKGVHLLGERDGHLTAKTLDPEFGKTFRVIIVFEALSTLKMVFSHKIDGKSQIC